MNQKPGMFLTALEAVSRFITVTFLSIVSTIVLGVVCGAIAGLFVRAFMLAYRYFN